MSAYVMFHIEEFRTGEDFERYLRAVDATLASHDGEILAQSFPAHVLEGEWRAFVTLVRFPDTDAVMSWYDSPEYRAIRDLRIANSSSTGLVLAGVPQGHRAADLLERFQAE